MKPTLTGSTLVSTREAAGQALLELAEEGFDVVAVSADTSKSMYTTFLKERFPERAVDVGIAEQNMMMVAAGLASTGKTAFAASYSVFTSMRCCEQIRTFIAYPRLNVKILAGIGGLSGGIEGATHIATEDLGIMRAIAGLTVIAPSDAVMTKKAVKAACAIDGPVYIRLGREPSPLLSAEKDEFIPGKPILRREGGQVTILATGLILDQVLAAGELLTDAGIEAEIIEVHTLKPILHPEIIRESVAKTGACVTVEEHNVTGGLAGAAAELLAGRQVYKSLALGLEDCFAESGTPEELRAAYGLDAASIAENIRHNFFDGRRQHVFDQ